jgi:hypothetical protein
MFKHISNAFDNSDLNREISSALIQVQGMLAKLMIPEFAVISLYFSSAIY